MVVLSPATADTKVKQTKAQVNVPGTGCCSRRQSPTAKQTSLRCRSCFRCLTWKRSSAMFGMPDAITGFVLLGNQEGKNQEHTPGNVKFDLNSLLKLLKQVFLNTRVATTHTNQHSRILEIVV